MRITTGMTPQEVAKACTTYTNGPEMISCVRRDLCEALTAHDTYGFTDSRLLAMAIENMIRVLIMEKTGA